MVALVQRRQKKFSRKSRVVPKIIRGAAPAATIRRISSWLFVVFCIVGFILVMRYIFQSTIFSSDYTITTVRYDSGSVSTFDEPLLYSHISDLLKDRNYYMTKIFGQREVFNAIQESFPMVSSFDLFFLEKNTAAVSLRFYDPLMVIYAWEQRFAVYDRFHIIPLYSQNTLGQNVLQLALADYITGVQNLDGMFFRISPEELYNQLLIFDDYFMKPYDTLYFPGAEKIQITAADGKIIYINNLWDISGQLRKIDLLKEYYDDFDAIWQFDLWSLDKNTVILRK